MIKKQKNAYHPQTAQWCVADGADVVNFNDGEASPGEACLCSILSGAFCALSTPTRQQCRAWKRQHGTFKSHLRAIKVQSL